MLAAVAVAVVPGCSRDDRSSGVEAGSTVPFVAVDPASASPTDREVAVQQTKLQADPDDANARLALATLFLQKVRETGDPTFYVKADSLLTGLAKSRKDDPAVLIARASLALGRHEFDEALRLGRRAVDLAPGNSAALGVVVDASNELGRYDEALEATQAMVDAKPDLASLSRVSYARELRGDLDGAITAMGQAVAAAGRSGENVAYTQVLLGNLLLNRGDLDGAEAAYVAAEQAFPGFALPKAGRARLLVARGDTAGAAELLGQVVQVLPTAEHVIAHGDALKALGRTREADEAYGLVRAIGRLNADNGVNVDLEMALFEADHSPGSDAVEAARKALKNRPGIQGHDVMAWSLFTARKGNAWPEAKKAIALGSRDPLIRYHAAAIAFQRGDRDAAAANLEIVLATNPRFSPVLAPRVSELANKLGLTPPPSPSD
ncbi:MAG: tetratricopeptide repeat protein [Actinobacteria bacterium]|nr:tetratricopeptide repeat protein [Actinomycetota bacterium]